MYPLFFDDIFRFKFAQIKENTAKAGKVGDLWHPRLQFAIFVLVEWAFDSLKCKLELNEFRYTFTSISRKAVELNSGKLKDTGKRNAWNKRSADEQRSVYSYLCLHVHFRGFKVFENDYIQIKQNVRIWAVYLILHLSNIRTQFVVVLQTNVIQTKWGVMIFHDTTAIIKTLCHPCCPTDFLPPRFWVVKRTKGGREERCNLN